MSIELLKPRRRMLEARGTTPHSARRQTISLSSKVLNNHASSQSKPGYNVGRSYNALICLDAAAVLEGLAGLSALGRGLNGRVFVQLARRSRREIAGVFRIPLERPALRTPLGARLLACLGSGDALPRVVLARPAGKGSAGAWGAVARLKVREAVVPGRAAEPALDAGVAHRGRQGRRERRGRRRRRRRGRR